MVGPMGVPEQDLGLRKGEGYRWGHPSRRLLEAPSSSCSPTNAKLYQWGKKPTPDI